MYGRRFGLCGRLAGRWATDEPVISTGTFHGQGINSKAVPWLNCVGTEIAIGLVPNVNGVVRYYHRSGAFGLFEPNADEGSKLGFGVQYQF